MLTIFPIALFFPVISFHILVPCFAYTSQLDFLTSFNVPWPILSMPSSAPISCTVSATVISKATSDTSLHGFFKVLFEEIFNLRRTNSYI